MAKADEKKKIRVAGRTAKKKKVAKRKPAAKTRKKKATGGSGKTAADRRRAYQVKRARRELDKGFTKLGRAMYGK